MTPRRSARRRRCAGGVGRRAAAAELLDRLTVVLEREGRVAEACDAARRGPRAGRGPWPAAHGRAPGPPPRGGRPRRCRRASNRPSVRGQALDSVPTVVRAGRECQPDPVPLTLAVEEAARGRRSRRGAASGADRRARASRGRPAQCGDGRVLPGARDPAVRSGHPPAAGRAVPRSRLARSRSREARAARPADPADGRRGRHARGCASWPAPGSRTTRGSAPCAADASARRSADRPRTGVRVRPHEAAMYTRGRCPLSRRSSIRST